MTVKFCHGSNASCIQTVSLWTIEKLLMLRYGRKTYPIAPAMQKSGKERTNAPLSKLSVLLIFVSRIPTDVRWTRWLVLGQATESLHSRSSLETSKLTTQGISWFQKLIYAMIDLSLIKTMSSARDR